MKALIFRWSSMVILWILVILISLTQFFCEKSREERINEIKNWEQTLYYEGIIEYLEAEDEEVFKQAVQSLFNIRDDAVDILLEKLKVVDDMDKKVRYMRALNFYKDEKIIEPYFELIESEDDTIKKLALAGLSNFHNPQIADLFYQYLNNNLENNSQDEEELMIVSRYYKNFPNDRVFSHWNSLINSDSPYRYIGALGLGYLGNSEAVPILLENLWDTDDAVRESSFYALKLIGDERACPEMEGAMLTELNPLIEEKMQIYYQELCE